MGNEDTFVTPGDEGADTSDWAVMRALIHQVAKAVPKGFNESHVRTVITRPLWRIWCRAVGVSEDSIPTDWKGMLTNRVYGSQTIVVESEHLAAVSIFAP